MEQRDLLEPQNAGTQNLPNATASLVLGIIAIIGIFCVGGGLILGIIGLILANKDRRLYAEFPDLYSASSLSNSNAGRICSIIGIVGSSIYIIAIVIVFLFAMITASDFLK